MRRIVWTAALIALVLGACSGAPDAADQVATSKGAPTPGQKVFPVFLALLLGISALH